MSGKAFMHVLLLLARALLQSTLTFLLLAPCGADVVHRRPTVLVLVHSSSQNDNETVSALITECLRTELESQGIRALPVAERTADDRAVAALAVKNGADFALWGTYVLAGSEIQFNARWVDPGNMAATGHASRTAALNLSFDAVVTSLVDEILEAQKPRIASLPLAPAEQTPAPASPAKEANPAQKLGEPERRPRIPQFALSVGSAPFIATFSALNYFPVGLTVFLTGHYQKNAPGGVFGFGLSSGLSGFHGKGAYAEADFYVVPIGVDVSYGTRTGSPIDFFAHLGGGPAIFAVKLTSGESLMKVIPYATGGLGISLSLFDSLGICLEGGYTCYFDSPDPIMGFAPALSALLRL